MKNLYSISVRNRIIKWLTNNYTPYTGYSDLSINIVKKKI